MMYLDSSAVLRLLYLEPESVALVDLLNRRPLENKVTSRFTEVELSRAVGGQARPSFAATVARLDRVEIDGAVLARAAGYPYSDLTAADAIHLATADHLVSSGKTVSAFISYNPELRAIATMIGLTVATPGQS